jgi:pimeloyl-ACP methyl ester carboxylesterase
MKITPFSLFDKFIDLSFKKNGLEFCQIDLGEYIMEYWISKADKPAVVLLHAFGPNGKYSWRKQIKILSKEYKIIIPNLLYFGNSTKKKNSTYNISEQIEALTQLLKHLKLDHFILGGTSYGGAIAFELLHEKSFSIQKLFITNSPVKYVFNDGWDKIMKDFKANKKSDLLIPNDYIKLKKLHDLTNYKKKYYPKFVFKDIYNTIYTHQSQERKYLVDAFEDDQKYLKYRVYKTDVPILLVWGEKDLISKLKTAKYLKRHLGENARLEIIPKTGHVPHIEKTAIFNKILIDFISN